MNTRGALAALLIALSSVAAASGADGSDDAASIRFSAPLNGWRNAQGQVERYTQDVRYPASSVNTPAAQSASALIAGSIARAVKDGKKPAPEKNDAGAVATLVVNGVALPQRIEPDGSFSRPYSFGAGSNSVELRDADGARRQVQFYEADRSRARPRLRIVLSWDSDATDLDLHVVSPDGQHAWYGERVVPNGGAIDVDVTTGFGPEIFSTAAPVAGSYLVYVNYFGGASTGAQDLTLAQIAILTEENTPAEKQQLFVVPMRKAGELTLVAVFVVR